jgi:hypothetical protein
LDGCLRLAQQLPSEGPIHEQRRILHLARHPQLDLFKGTLEIPVCFSPPTQPLERPGSTNLPRPLEARGRQFRLDRIQCLLPLSVIEQRLNPLCHQKARTGSPDSLFEAEDSFARPLKTLLPSTALQIRRNELRIPLQGLGTILQGLQLGALSRSTVTADHQNCRPLSSVQSWHLKCLPNPQQGLRPPSPLEFNLGQFEKHQ